MKRLMWLILMLVFALGIPVQAMAVPLKVALYFTTHDLEVLTDNPDLDITVFNIADLNVDPAGPNPLIDGGFDVLFGRLFNNPNFPIDQPNVIANIQEFVNNGGGYVGDIWGAGGALSGRGTQEPLDPSGSPPVNFLGLFSGLASGGANIGNSTPVTITQPSHPVVAGVSSPFASPNGTQFFVLAEQPLDPGLTVLATAVAYDATIPVIMVGTTGPLNSGVVLLFSDMSEDKFNPDIERLLLNSFQWAADQNTPPPVRPIGAITRRQCTDFEAGRSAQIVFNTVGGVENPEADIQFFDVPGCPMGQGRPGVPSDIEESTCSQTHASDGVCVRRTKNTPTIITIQIAGVGAVEECIDEDLFDAGGAPGAPVDECKKPGGAKCRKNSQCATNKCKKKSGKKRGKCTDPIQ